MDPILLADAVRNLRALILASERYRQVVADSVGLGTTESAAISYLAVHGDRGQSDLARDLSLTSSASTAMVDRLESRGVAERIAHAKDRRRSVVRLTERGRTMVSEGQEWLAFALDRVGAEDLETVAKSLGVIAEALIDHTAELEVNGPADGLTHALPVL